MFLKIMDEIFRLSKDEHLTLDIGKVLAVNISWKRPQMAFLCIYKILTSNLMVFVFYDAIFYFL